MAAEDYFNEFDEFDEEWGNDRFNPTFRIPFTRHITNTIKASLFENDKGQFWVPKTMIESYYKGVHSYIRVYSDFELTYLNNGGNTLTEIDGDF